jgi:SAM-dependent methyltransferase
MSTFREIYRADQLPVLQNRMFDTEEDARSCARGDVVLVQDLATGLIYNRVFQPELLQYDGDYQNEQAFSPAFREHLGQVSRVVRNHFHGLSLLEIGCGKGFFLTQLQREGFDIKGVDPTYEGANPAIIKAHFDSSLDLRGDGIVLRHVLEHVQDPVAFLAGLDCANGGGKIYIEVPCFDWICSHRAWFDVFYEHVNYFRLGDLRRMFRVVHESGHAFGGQYVYLVADLATIRQPTYDASAALTFPDDFLETVGRHARGLRERREQPLAVWGAASKGVIFALFMERAGASIDLIIDANPAKQGRYIAATGLRVESPERAVRLLPPDARILVMNGNYFAEIRDQTENRFHYETVDS